ncbi:MAG TPA: hypothetical protein VGS19_36615 [Streptosporangiaceae bacterium]|nr:hypothetical protein [Streptosporangiaceae bacterium]
MSRFTPFTAAVAATIVAMTAGVGTAAAAARGPAEWCWLAAARLS